MTKASSSSNLDVITFGCRLNTLDSEVMLQSAKEAGVENAVLVNTCAVTSQAVRQARQAIRRTKRERPDCRIIVTGCAAQTEARQFADMSEVDIVLGNEEKLATASYQNLPDFGVSAEEKTRVNDIMAVRETAPHMIEAMGERTRAFVQVQTGCDHRCTFCIIPYGRGNSRSVPMGAVVDQIKRLVENGYLEVVLTGVDITSYGADLEGKPSLGALVQNILTLVPDLPRLRLSSIDSIEVDGALMEVIRYETRLLPHLHLSLQSGDDMILKRMKRRHLRDQSIAFCEEVRKARPDMVFGADLIAGFPTETDAMFDNSLRLVEDCDITYLHVFPYSPRPGTPAAKMPQVKGAVIKQRAQKLRDKGADQVSRHLDRCVGHKAMVLVEKKRPDGTCLGRTEHFTLTSLDKGQEGEMIPVVITGRTDTELVATPLKGAPLYWGFFRELKQ